MILAAFCQVDLALFIRRVFKFPVVAISGFLSSGNLLQTLILGITCFGIYRQVWECAYS